MVATTNTCVVLAKYPTEYPVPGEHLVVETTPFDPNAVELADGEILLMNYILSVDPYMRERMNPKIIKPFMSTFQLGVALQGHGIAKVIKTRNEKFQVGDWVYGLIGWEEYTHASASWAKTFKVMNHIMDSDLPMTYYVGCLGMPGLTAYIGLLKIGQPKKGETLFVSAAAGAVGQIVGQLGKIEGMRVVGSAGSDAKVEFLIKECKYDAAFNYKEDTGEKLQELCKDGIDVYFENVGGRTLEQALDNANNFSRVVACGMISTYNTPDPEPVRNLVHIVFKRIRMQGFIGLDWEAEYGDEFTKNVTAWLKEGKLVYKEDVVEGIANAPEAFVGMLKGKNFGKMVVKIRDV